ncbi:hypothetical protein, partial [Thiolapillus sp.]|uniref:hypothetical protein n=1 Tax=Thiolapillus sp. TaxID=2017437 RepID=UPI0025D580E2
MLSIKVIDNCLALKFRQERNTTLAIFQSRDAEGKALKESRNGGAHEKFTYYIPRLVPLRQLV